MNRKSANTKKYLLNIKKNLLPKRNKDIHVSLCCKKCVISFPIQYCFLKAWILKNTIFMIKKYDFFFWWTKVKKKLCTNTRKKMKKYERTNVVFKMIFSVMRLFVQKVIAFWMTASLVWVLGRDVPRRRHGIVHKSSHAPCARTKPCPPTQDVCSTFSLYSLLSYNIFSRQ